MNAATWFRFDTHNEGEVVHKISREWWLLVATGESLVKSSKRAHDIHREYLGDFVPAETDVQLYGPDGQIIVHQEMIKGCQHVDLIEEKNNPELLRLLEDGARMQKEQGILFDILGMQGMIEAWNNRFKDHKIKKVSDFLTPANAGLLKIFFGTSPETLSMLRDSFPGGLIAYNILKSPEWKFYFCDNTDLRPLKKFPIHPEHVLNKLGNWITNLVLKENGLPRASDTGS